MHWPSVPDALTAEPSTRPPSPHPWLLCRLEAPGVGGRLVSFLPEVPVPRVSGCCAVWKHQRREGRGKRFHSPVCSRLRQNKEKKDRNSLVDTPGAHHCAYDRPSRISTVPSPQSTSEHQAKQIGRTLLQTHTCLIFTAVRSVRSWTVRAPNPTRKLSIQIDRSG